MDRHDWEIDVVAVLKNIGDWHIHVQFAFKFLVHYCQDKLKNQIENEHGENHFFAPGICILSILDALVSESFHTEAFAHAVIQLANFVHHSSFDEVA